MTRKIDLFNITEDITNYIYKIYDDHKEMLMSGSSQTCNWACYGIVYVFSFYSTFIFLFFEKQKHV